MQILLAATSFGRSRELLRAAAPTADWLTLEHDATLRLNAASVKADAVRPEVAWLNSDLVTDQMAARFAELVEDHEAIRWLQYSGAGLDVPLFHRLVGRGVRLSTSHVSGPPIADYVLRCALDHVQNAEHWRAGQTARTWAKSDFVEMNATRWLIIGLGSIGREVAARAGAFGAEIIGVRRRPLGDEPVDRMIAPREVWAVLPACDIVVLSAPANHETENLVDDAFCSAMRPGSALINVARGALVVEEALIRGLSLGKPRRAYLDVTQAEPLPPDHQFWTHPAVAITPHNAALGMGRHGRVAGVFAANLGRYAAGERLLHEVDPEDMPVNPTADDFIRSKPADPT